MPGNHCVVLAFSGLRSTYLELQPLLKRLNAEGYTVFAPHLRGYGFSQDPSTGTWTEWLAEAVAHFDDLAARYAQVVVCGLSMGATLALAVAAERGNRVTAVVPLSTTLHYDGWNTPWYRFLSPLGYFTPLRHRMLIRESSPFGLKDERLRAWIERQVAAEPITAVGASALSLPALHEAARLMKHTRRALVRVTAPVQLVHAIEDDIAHIRSAYTVQRMVRSLDVRLLKLANSYHMLTLDFEKVAVAKMVADFLNFYISSPESNTNGACNE
ncbi:MAG TPA: alpha/beta fold hydrolase [Halothiobacillus sp.]|nr:alpha/beta fold hydrolase [Halothiobacillus sp.]